MFRTRIAMGIHVANHQLPNGHEFGLAEIKKRSGRALVKGFYLTLANGFKMSPLAIPSLYGIERIRDVPYTNSGLSAHRLDIYRPKGTGRPRPAVIYIHGGGFHFMSKETHWIMATLFASRGYVVFNIEYRMAPKHRFPAAVIDAVTAYEWVVENRSRYGADGPIVLAGESAGANLAWATTLCACTRRQETWAKEIFDLHQPPAALVSACGMLQVTDPQRYLNQGIPWIFYDRIAEISDIYLPRNLSVESPLRDLADPLVALEAGPHLEHPLPATIATVGGADPLVEDTMRLQAALAALDVPVRALVYEGEIHSFQPMVFRANARKSWADTFRFLEEDANITPNPVPGLGDWILNPSFV